MAVYAFDAVAGEPAAEVQQKYCFSLFGSLADPSPQTVTLDELVMLLTEGESKIEITKIRGEPDKKRRAELKRRLPCVAVSGEFEGGHGAEHLVRHSGLICLDLDADRNPCMVGCAAEWRDKLVQDEFVRAAFVSASGNGVAVVCRIEGDRHAEAFDALQAYFKGRHGLAVDPSCRDVTRLRFLSWDPEAAVNEHARTFRRYALGGEAAPREGGVRKEELGVRTGLALSRDRREEIESALERLSPDGRQAWLDVGMAVQSEAPGLEGFNLWRRWSEFNDTASKFDEPDLERVWRSFKGSGTRIETLFKMAYASGWKGPPVQKRVTGALPAIAADVWLASPVPPRDPVVEGMIDAGTFVELIAPSKARKSFFAMQMANCIASGRKFIEWAVPRPRKVLLINVELIADRAHDREAAMVKGLGIERGELSRLIVCNLRGLDIPDPVESICATIREHRPEVTIIDPLYMIHGEDESDPVAMMALYKRLLVIQSETKSAIMVVHHDAKGKAGDRDKRDRGSGSGVMGRFCDSRILLTPHKNDPENWVIVEMMYRYLPPQKDATIRMEDGRLVVVEGVESVPETSKNACRTVLKSDAVMDAALAKVVPDIVANGPYNATVIKQKLCDYGVTNKTKLSEGVTRLKEMAAKTGALFSFTDLGGNRVVFGTLAALYEQARPRGYVE